MHKWIGLTTALCATVLALLAGSAFSASGASSSLPPPSFRPSPAWLVLTTGTSNVPTEEGVWAITARSNLAAFAPFDPTSLRHLSRDAVYVEAQIEGKARRPASSEWPLHLSRFRVDHQWEGQPAPNVQQRLRFVGVRGWQLYVRVFFATQHPSKRLLHAAQAELDRLLLPRR
jgi:hypothetical protein